MSITVPMELLQSAATTQLVPIPQGARDTKEAPEVKDLQGAETLNKDSKKLSNHQVYRRVGDKFEKTITNYDVEGRSYEDIIQLNKDTIVDRHGKDFLHSIQIYDAHTIIPSHTDYKQVVGSCWNLYKPLVANPIKGDHKAWDILMSRMFGEQIELGWDYLTIMYRFPTHLLPVLCFVSKENHTGKSTFGNALAELFGRNVGFFTQDDLTSSFNQWIKYLVAVFEEISETKHTLNKIKAMATAKSATLNEKYIKQVTFQPFVKLIILSNNDSTFIRANKEDIRYWIRKLEPIPQGAYVKDFDEQLRREAPAVLYTLHHRSISTPKSSRMWFAPELIATEALEKVRKESRSEIVQDLEVVINELLAEHRRFYATPTDFGELLRNKHSISKIASALKSDFGCIPEKQMRFHSVTGRDRNGTPYLFYRPVEYAEDEEEVTSLPF